MRAMDAIVQRLVQKGLGTAGVTLFAGTETDLPVLPANQVLGSVLESGGEPPQTTHSSGSIRRPHFQVTFRHSRYPDAAAKAEAAWLALGGEDGVANVQISDVFFLYIRPQQEPFGMPVDANSRARVSFNVATAWRR
jgi:hypothetical protein